MDDQPQHPVLRAFAAAVAKDRRALTKRAGVRVPRDHLGRFVTGCSGNPRGRPRNRESVRVAFHKFGLLGIEKLAALVDDPTLSPVERAAICGELVRLTCCFRAIHFDSKIWRKTEQLRRERELHAAMLAVFQKAGVPRNEWPDPPARDPTTSDPGLAALGEDAGFVRSCHAATRP